MPHSWPQEQNMSLSFAPQFLREPQSWNQPCAAKTSVHWRGMLNSIVKERSARRQPRVPTPGCNQERRRAP